MQAHLLAPFSQTCKAVHDRAQMYLSDLKRIASSICRYRCCGVQRTSQLAARSGQLAHGGVLRLTGLSRAASVRAGMALDDHSGAVNQLLLASECHLFADLLLTLPATRSFELPGGWEVGCVRELRSDTCHTVTLPALTCADTIVVGRLLGAGGGRSLRTLTSEGNS